MEYYESYEAKIDELKKHFGTFPPPFDPPWCIQVSTARCGSNALWDMVKSFLPEDAIGYPCYEHLDHDNRDENWTPAPGKKYLYYNVFDLNPQRLHFPIFIWMLQHCPKIVFLSREDHFARTISLYYADVINERLSKQRQEVKRAFYYPEMFSEPIDSSHFNNLLHSSLIKMESLKKIVKAFVEEKRLHEVKFSDLYHHRTLGTLGDLADFLEQDTREVEINVRVKRETLHERIPNLEALLDQYDRDNILERDHWVPNDIDMDSIHEHVNTTVDELIHLNTVHQGDTGMKINFNIKSNSKSSGDTFHFNLDTDLRFYIDEIPKGATYLKTEVFAQLPDMYENIYLLDSRWKDIEAPIDSHIHELFEVTDIHSNRARSYKWICGLSGFFLKSVIQEDHLHRTQPETHNKLIEGVRAMVEYEERCPETLLRFYVSAEVWERLATENLLDSDNTEFYKMAYPSEDSQLGTIWRMLALFDKEFAWAIETDIAPDEGWVFARIAHWDRQLFTDWLEENTGQHWAWAGEYLIHEDNYSEKQNSFCWDDRCWDPGPFDFMSGGGIVTRPERMPSPESVIHRHIMERPLSLTYYHAGENVWCQFPCYETQIPLGWEGWGVDQSVWGRLKKVMPVRHILHEQSLQWMRQVDPAVIPQHHLLRRLIAQLHAEGSEFVDWKTLEPIFTFS